MKTRRDFIKTMSLLTTATMLPFGTRSALGFSNSDKFGEILPLRRLGPGGEKVTMLGLGGYHVGWTTEKDAREVIEAAMEGGIRFFDTAHSYGDGTSEERYGKYLVPDYRDQVFIMTKSTAKTGDHLLEEFDLSLKRLNCDYIDLLQIHSIRDPLDVDNRVKNDVIKAAQKIKDSGKARLIGFTGHQSPYAHLRMLEHIKELTDFTTVQMPVNLVDYASEHSFIQKVLPQALDQDLGILAMKTLADGRFFGKKVRNTNVQWETDNPVIPDYVSVKEASHFAWSLPISVLITGAENKLLLQEKIRLARDFSKLSEQEREKLLSRVKQAPNLNEVEYYKDV